jgi:hypothetical protein
LFPSKFVYGRVIVDKLIIGALVVDDVTEYAVVNAKAWENLGSPYSRESS